MNPMNQPQINTQHNSLKITQPFRNTFKKPFQKSVLLNGLLATALSIGIWGYSSAWAAGYQLESIGFNPATNAISIQSRGAVKGTVNSVNVGSKKRIIFDIENAEIGSNLPKDKDLLRELSRHLPSIQNISVNQFGGHKPVVRILLDVNNKQSQIQLLQSYGERLELKITPPNYMARQPVNQPANNYRPPAQPSPNQNYLQSEIGRLRQANQSLQNELGRLTQALQQQQQQPTVNPETERQFRSLQSKYAELADENSRLRSQVSNLNAAQPLTDAEFNAIKKQLADAKKALGESITTINGQNREIAVLKTELSQLNTGISDSRQAELDRLNSRVETSQKALEASDKQVSALKAQIQQLQAEKTAMSKPVRIQPEVIQDTAKIRSLEAEIAKKDALIARMTDDMKSLNTRNEDDRKPEVIALSRNPAPGEVDRLNSELDNLKKQYKALVMEHNRDKANHDAELAKEKDKYEQALNNLNQFDNNSAISDKDNKIKALSNEIDDLKGKLAKATETINTQQKAARNTGDTKTLKKKIAALEKELATSKKSSMGLKPKTTDNSKLATLEKDNAALEKELASTQAEYKQLTTASISLQEEIKQLKTELNDATKKVQMQSRLVETASSNSVENSELEKEIASLKKENEALTLKIVDVKKGSDKLQAMPLKISNLEKDLEKANKTITKLKAENKKSKRRGSKSKNNGETESLKKQIDYINEQLIAAQKKNEDYESVIDRLNKELKNQTLVQVPKEALPSRVISSEAAQKAENHYKLGSDLANDNQADLASQEFKRALETDPDNIKYVYALSSSLAKEGKRDEAIKTLEHFLTSHPNEYIAYNQMGKIYLTGNDYMHAKEAFARGIPINTLSNYASTLKKLDLYEDSENAYKLAVLLNPKDSEVLFNLGNLYNTVNELNKAENTYIQAINSKPDFPEAHYNLGLVYSKLDDRKNAVKHLEKFLELSPGNHKSEAIKNYVSKLKK